MVYLLYTQCIYIIEADKIIKKIEHRHTEVADHSDTRVADYSHTEVANNSY